MTAQPSLPADFDGTSDDPFANINSTVIPERHVVVVTGSRNAYDDKAWHVVFNVLDRAHRVKPITLIVHGGATGIDTIADAWADRNNVRCLSYSLSKEDWEREGKAAGPKRNRRMVNEQKPDVVVGFVNVPLEQSRGTKSCLQIAGEQGYATHLYHTTTGAKEF